ncbi:MAG TPA: hypothetical protein VFU15_17065 [Bacteroidia bacterium]|nr:hypothetical protein [Bacteroidia bacterium]
MRLRFLPVFFLPGLFFLAACSSNPGPKKDIVSKYIGVLPTVVDNDEGLFHGIMLGMTPEEVKAHAISRDSLGEEKPGYLMFQGRISGKEEYLYDCQFDTNGLFTLELDIYLKDKPSGDSIFSDFKSYYTARFGTPQEEKGMLIWTCNEGTRPAKIIIDEDPAYSYGELTVTIYDKTFDTPPPGVSDSLNGNYSDSLDGKDTLILP